MTCKFFEYIEKSLKVSGVSLMRDLVFLPVHVWDREFDSRLVIAYMLGCLGHTSIIGHEYNMCPLYFKSEKCILFRAGSPIDHPVRGGWHHQIKKNCGIVITHDEEGVNNMPIYYQATKGHQGSWIK